MSGTGRPRLHVHGEAWEPTPLPPDQEAELLRMIRIIGYRAAFRRIVASPRPGLRVYGKPGTIAR